MDLYAVIDQVMALLQQRGRLTYRALQYQFGLERVMHFAPSASQPV